MDSPNSNQKINPLNLYSVSFNTDKAVIFLSLFRMKDIKN